MTFYEQELRKIVGERYPDATYVGRACYVRLSDMNRAKIQFVTGSVANQYNALQLTILNRSEGQVDTLRLRFSDLLGHGYVDKIRAVPPADGALCRFLRRGTDPAGPALPRRAIQTHAIIPRRAGSWQERDGRGGNLSIL